MVTTLESLGNPTNTNCLSIATNHLQKCHLLNLQFLNFQNFKISKFHNSLSTGVQILLPHGFKECKFVQLLEIIGQ